MRPPSFPDLQHNSSTLRTLASFFVVAAHTGLWSALYKRLHLRDSLIAAGVSGAGGVVVGALCVYGWGPDRWYLTCGVCGIVGWMGGNVVLDKLSIVAWTIARGYVSVRQAQFGKPQLSTTPLPDVTRDAPASSPLDLGDLDYGPRKE